MRVTTRLFSVFIAPLTLLVMVSSAGGAGPTIDSQIVNLKNSGANVFFDVTIPKFAVQAIKKAHDIGWKPVHLLGGPSANIEVVLSPAGREASTGGCCLGNSTTRAGIGKRPRPPRTR